MPSVEFVFLGLGLIIVAGYLGLAFFKKTKVSEIIILLMIGLLIGPISDFLGFGIIGQNEMVLFDSFLPFFASLALIMILFEGGLQLNFFKTIKALPGSLAFTISVFLTNMLFTILILWLMGAANLMPFNILIAVFIAAVLGGTSSAVIIPLVKNTSAREETKTLLSLESALTDALCVITAVAVAQIFLVGSVSLDVVFSGILANFSIAAVIGFAFGLVWLNILGYLQGKSYEYLMTIAALLVVYSSVQMLGGNGAIAALMFGIVLGNAEDITEMLKLTKRKIDTNIISFQGEISFLVKIFFFVYLGILFKIKFLTAPVLIISGSVIITIFLSRYLISKALIKLKPIYTLDQQLISFLSARGLAAAVLASVPISMGLDKVAPEIFSVAFISQLSAIIFLVIFGTNILTTIGVFIFESGKPKPNTPKEKEEMLTELKAIAKPKVIK